MNRPWLFVGVTTIVVAAEAAPPPRVPVATMAAITNVTRANGPDRLRRIDCSFET